MTSDTPEPPEQQGPARGALIALLLIVVLVVGGFWLSRRIHGANQVQDCVMAGRTNCAPVP